MTAEVKDLSFYLQNPEQVPTDPDQLAQLAAMLEGSSTGTEQTENTATVGGETGEGEGETDGESGNAESNGGRFQGSAALFSSNLGH